MTVSRAAFVALALSLLAIGVGIGFLAGYVSQLTPKLSATCLTGVSEDIINEPDLSITDALFEEMRADNIEKYLKEITASPHMAGTPADYAQAKALQDFWDAQAGLDSTRMDTYDVPLSYPETDKPNHVQLLDSNGEVVHESAAREAPLTDTQRPDEMVAPYNSYSASGDPVSDLVYVNYCTEKDLRWITEEKGIELTGRILIARYGSIARFTKTEVAQKYGAAGLILYSDPANFALNGTQDVYPDSWWMPGSGVQRGSILAIGDPLTQGFPATEDAYRLPLEDAVPIHIPVHPIGYDDAHVFLANMAGEEAPEDWRGTLPITYRLGPGFANPNWRVKMDINMKTEMATIHNVFATIKGSVEPDRYVLLGNHIDAWGFGAVDPSSGTAALMELARAMAQLVDNGWRPKRSIMFCGWGAEEFGLIGSREWVENYATLLSSRTVAYINVDIAVQGRHMMRVKALPLLSDAIFRAAKKVKNPDAAEVAAGRGSVYDTWLHRDPDDQAGYSDRPKVLLLGSGSDFDPFVNMIGVTSTDLRYTFDPALQLSSYPLYHTAYETFHLVKTHIDPEFKYHIAVAQLVGELGRELADSLILPLDVREYPRQLALHMDTMQWPAAAANSPAIMKRRDFMIMAKDEFKKVAGEFHDSLKHINTDNPYDVRRVNDQMMQLERAFVNPQGLPGNPLNRHVIFSPSAADAYAGAVFPGLTEALWHLDNASGQELDAALASVQQQTAMLAHYIRAAAASLRQPSQF